MRIFDVILNYVYISAVWVVLAQGKIKINNC